MRRVAATMDNNPIVTAFPDRNATNNWNMGNRDCFAGRYAETGTLTTGETASAPSLITESGYLVAHWRLDKMDPAGFMEPIGVTVRNAKATLNRVRVL